MFDSESNNSIPLATQNRWNPYMLHIHTYIHTYIYILLPTDMLSKTTLLTLVFVRTPLLSIHWKKDDDFPPFAKFENVVQCVCDGTGLYCTRYNLKKGRDFTQLCHFGNLRHNTIELPIAPLFSFHQSMYVYWLSCGRSTDFLICEITWCYGHYYYH